MDSKELFFWTGIPLYHRPIDNGSKLIYDPISNWEKEPTFLKLKEGAKVMFVKNNRPYWVNGSVGIVQEIDDKVLTIKKGWKNYDLQPTEWEEYKFKYNRESGVLEKSLVGTFSQMPLILAWAITIHKGQGTTLDSVHIDLDRGSFDFGQTYVALSRTRQLSDISIEKPIKSSDIKVDERINEYFDSLEFEKY